MNSTQKLKLILTLGLVYTSINSLLIKSRLESESLREREMVMVMEEPIAIEEAISMGVEKGDGLKTRQRRRRKAVEESEFETNKEEEELTEEDGMAATEVEANEVEEKKEADGTANGEHRSIYYDPDQGVEAVDDVSVMKLTEVDAAVVPGKIASGKPALNHAKEVIQTEIDQFLKNVKVEERPSSYTYSEIQSEETKYDSEIEEHEQLAILDKSKLKTSGFDLKRILEEQDTHDLVCPNCKSCITRRVLLRKRKRTTRETPSDAPTQKIFKGQDVRDFSSDSTRSEMPNEANEEGPDIFRCLSCFTFFIPKGPIMFPKFGKKRENQVHSSEKIIEREDSWFSSIFKSKESKKQERESGANLVQKKEEDFLSITSGSAGEIKSIEKKNNEGANLVLHKEESSLSITSGSAREIKSIEENNNEVILQHKSSSMKIQEKVKDLLENINLSDQVISSSDATVHTKEKVVNDIYFKNSENDTTMHVSISKTKERVDTSSPSLTVTGPNAEIRIGMPGQNNLGSEARNELDILKSIVYGGLIESIVSLSIVSSAAGANSSTLNIVAIALANVIGGIPLISHNLFDLRNTQQTTDESDECTGRYWELLGRRKNIGRHFFVAIMSYIIFGLLPPVIYGFSFRGSDNKNYKLIAVAAASLLFIALLAIGKAHVQTQNAHFKTAFYYLCLAVPVSGLSYVAGVMLNRLFEELGLFNNGTAPIPPSLDISWNVPALASF